MALARQKRYELLYEACIAANSPVLLTGHHLGDQMETFVSRFFGASGVDGLSGMQPASLIRPGCPGPLFNMHSTIDHPILLLRPFLGVEKSELVRYCEDAGLSYVKDPTNVDSFFARARVRKVLASAPSVAEDIAAVQRSCTDARKLQEDSAFVLLQKTWICNEGSLCDGGRAVFDVGPFVGSTRWVVRRLMLVVLQIIARKEYPPRSGIDSLVNALLSGRLTCNFDFGGCLVQPVKKSKGSQIAITKSSTRRGVLKEMVDGF
ncbi:hypothetical protein BSKO_05058 [Bryopsis sp. KO-2023]|nr:hypothetical protein BSKO_05058 [Bryopsis sp. KO-2023]